MDIKKTKSINGVKVGNIASLNGVNINKISKVGHVVNTANTVNINGVNYTLLENGEWVEVKKKTTRK